MANGDLIDEETSGAGCEKPAWSGIEDHDPQKVGVPASWFATPSIAAGKARLKTA